VSSRKVLTLAPSRPIVAQCRAIKYILVLYIVAYDGASSSIN
jgi:hypothetical protein